LISAKRLAARLKFARFQGTKVVTNEKVEKSERRKSKSADII